MGAYKHELFLNIHFLDLITGRITTPVSAFPANFCVYLHVWRYLRTKKLTYSLMRFRFNCFWKYHLAQENAPCCVNGTARHL